MFLHVEDRQSTHNKYILSTPRHFERYFRGEGRFFLSFLLCVYVCVCVCVLTCGMCCSFCDG